MTSIEPELWVERAGEAVRFYEVAFGATTLHRVGDGDDIVVQLGIGDARFWVAPAEHGWRIGRIIDPFGHEWEIGRPLGVWPPGR